MSLQHAGTGATTQGWPATVPGLGPGRGLVLAVTLLAGVFMVAAGAWALLAARLVRRRRRFPRHTHFVHDAGAFQLGIRDHPCLLAAHLARDGPALALAGSLVADLVHTVKLHAPSTSTSAATARHPSGSPPSRPPGRRQCAGPRPAPASSAGVVGGVAHRRRAQPGCSFRFRSSQEDGPADQAAPPATAGRPPPR